VIDGVADEDHGHAAVAPLVSPVSHGEQSRRPPAGRAGAAEGWRGALRRGGA